MWTRSNDEWLHDLRAAGTVQEAALRDLRETILRSLRGYLAAHPQGKLGVAGEAAQLAQDCTQEALLILLDKLDTFRGDSRFTTWVYQIGIRVLLGELRRRRWQEVSLDRQGIDGSLPVRPIEDRAAASPEQAFHRDQIWRIFQEIIDKELTHRQRAVLVAHVFQGEPLDQLAERLATNRDAVYKLIHDARKKLRRCLEERGLAREEILGAFAAQG
jgi:RNA polymerase sigma-70 factor (ECF subfamily)